MSEKVDKTATPVSPSHRHAAKSAESFHTRIRAHIERHLGPVTNVFRGPVGDAASIESNDDTASIEPIDDAASIDVQHVASTKTRPIQTLITAGMSDLPMSVPANAESPRYLELMMTLPESWKLDDQSAAQVEWAWPIRQLRSVALYPRKFSTWLDWGRIVPNGDPPEALAPNTKLCGAIIVPSLLVPTDFYELNAGAKTIAFYSVVPLYREEMQLKARDGMGPLLEKMVDHGITDLIDPKRRNVAVKRRFGLF